MRGGGEVDGDRIGGVQSQDLYVDTDSDQKAPGVCGWVKFTHRDSHHQAFRFGRPSSTFSAPPTPPGRLSASMLHSRDGGRPA